MLVEYVEPAFQSPHGHLRAKACWVAGTYADIQFEGGAGKGRTFQLLMRHVIQGLQDPELPVSDYTYPWSSTHVPALGTMHVTQPHLSLAIT